MRKVWLSCIIGSFLLASCGSTVAQPTPTAPSATTTSAPSGATQPLKIVASTSWVGAFAKAAGATDITIIAPSSVQHPPDYDPKPSDLQAVADADYVLYAGFEGFAPRLQEAVGGSAERLLTVQTENSPAVIKAEVLRLSDLFGTRPHAEAFLTGFDAEYTRLSQDVRTALGAQTPIVVSQAFVVPWVGFAGLEPAGVYGPAPLTPEELATLTKAQPRFIFENVHMGGGQPIAEATTATVINLINFPDADLDLLAVFQRNAATLKAALGTTP